jgi:hypothetical protein
MNTLLTTVIDSQAFAWFVFLGFVLVACSMVIGFAQGYQHGHSDGWDDAERYVEDELQFGDDEWGITEEGQRALRAARLAEIDSMLLTPQQTMPFVKTHSHVS